VAHTIQIPHNGGPLISVIVCTRNRAELLTRAVASVVGQEFPRDDYEILVVDNGSTDRTPEVAAQFQGRADIRCLREERVALCIARNTGWQAASGRYVVFFDDDAIALPGWLAAIRDGFGTAPEIGVIGGRVHPIWGGPRPSWLSDAIAGSLTIVDWGPSGKFIDDIRREWLVGANMAVPKALLAEVGGFHPWLDRVGNNLLSSGDVFLQKELMRRGYRCLYLPAMAVQHLVPASRLNQQWFVRRFYWQGVSDAVMHLIEKKPSPPARVRLALARSAAVLRSPRRMASLLLPTDRPNAFAAKCFALIDLGFISGLLGAARH
jgi:glucosyl-dolichyl phosphate glucuronosyltransferase